MFCLELFTTRQKKDLVPLLCVVFSNVRNDAFYLPALPNIKAKDVNVLFQKVIAKLENFSKTTSLY